jgi:8-oxo-dGTP pyrophosphatase MutT (NUDIX family)
LAFDRASRVARIAACHLTVTDERWAFADDNRAAIAAHWARRTADNPQFFNGIVYVMRRPVLAGDALTAACSPVPFADFLYWRETGFPDSAVHDGFGSALIRSREGHVLLGRQGAGNINAGKTYLPGGLIDDRDVAAGRIDIEGSIAREMREETGLDPTGLQRTPGFLVTVAGPMISIAAEYRADATAEELTTRVRAFLRREASPELDDVVVLRTQADLDDAGTSPYAVTLLRTVLPA